MKKIILVLCMAISCILITGCGSEKEKFTVTFDSNGGSYVDSQIVEKNGMVEVPVDPIRAGYIFVEWLLDDIKYDFNNKVTRDITLKANWALGSSSTYTVTFNSNGGSTVKSANVNEGGYVSCPKPPTRDGYIFLGWYLGDNEYNFSNKVLANITLTAKWEKVSENTHVVTFDSNGGSAVKSQKVVDGKVVSKPENPTRKGYNFVEWQLNATSYDFTSAVKGDLTLVAVWEALNEYTVTFDTDGGTVITSVKVYENEKVAKPNNPTRDGYEFVKWQLDGEDYSFNTKVTKNITLVAVWKKVVKVESVTLSELEKELTIGEDFTLTATVNPSDAENQEVIWTSSDESIATVSENGLVTSVKDGEVTITATVDGVSSSCKVIVVKPVTYEVEYQKAKDTSLDQHYLFITSSNGKHVAGVIEITTINGDVIDVSVTENGSSIAYVKTVIDSARVKSLAN